MAFLELYSSSTFNGVIYKREKRPGLKIVVSERWTSQLRVQLSALHFTSLTRDPFHGGRNLGRRHLPRSPVGPEPLSRPQTHLPLRTHSPLHPVPPARRNHFPVSEKDKTDGLLRAGGRESENRGGGESERGVRGESDRRRSAGGEALQKEIRAVNLPSRGCDVNLRNHVHGRHGSLLPVFVANGGKLELRFSVFSPFLYFPLFSSLCLKKFEIGFPVW